MGEQKKDQSFTLCFRCGAPLTKKQTAVFFSGQYSKFFAHEVGSVTFYLCEECERATDTFIKGGIRAAVQRMDEANKIDDPVNGEIRQVDLHLSGDDAV